MPGHDPTEHEFDSLDKLLSVKFIKHIRKQKDFVQFSVSKSVKGKSLLMAEYSNSFWAVGYLDNLEHLETLPDFHDLKSSKAINV